MDFILFSSIAAAASLYYRKKKSTIYLQPEYVRVLNSSNLKPKDDFFVPSLVYDCKNLVGECPVWDNLRQLLLWLDIEGFKLFTLSLAGTNTKYFYS